MIAVIGLVGFIIATALVQWFVSAQVWQGSDIDDLMGDEEESSECGIAEWFPVFNGWNG